MGIFRRIMGFLITFVSVVALIIGIVGAVLLPGVFRQIQSQTGGVLGQVVSALDSTEVTIETVRDTITEASNSLTTAEETTQNLSTTIIETDVVFDEIVTVMGENVPASIETVQTALPNLIVVADTVDQALLQLSQFGVDESFGGTAISLPDVEVLGQEIPLPSFQLPRFPISFDLGIDYNPDTAFDESLIGIEKDLDGIPESLRSLAVGLEGTKENVNVVGNDIASISSDIGSINAQVSLLPEQIDGYLATFNGLQEDIVSMEASINAQLNTVRTVLVVLMIWFALIQLAPLYLGVHLMLGRKLD